MFVKQTSPVDWRDNLHIWQHFGYFTFILWLVYCHHCFCLLIFAGSLIRSCFFALLKLAEFYTWQMGKRSIQVCPLCCIPFLCISLVHIACPIRSCLVIPLLSHKQALLCCRWGWEADPTVLTVQRMGYSLAEVQGPKWCIFCRGAYVTVALAELPLSLNRAKQWSQVADARRQWWQSLDYFSRVVLNVCFCGRI